MFIMRIAHMGFGQGGVAIIIDTITDNKIEQFQI